MKDNVNRMIVIADVIVVVPIDVIREVHTEGAVAMLTGRSLSGGTCRGSCREVVGGFASLRGAGLFLDLLVGWFCPVCYDCHGFPL